MAGCLQVATFCLPCRKVVLSEIRLFTVRSAKHMTIAFAGGKSLNGKACSCKEQLVGPRNNAIQLQKFLSTMFCTTRRIFDGNRATDQLQIKVFPESFDQVLSFVDLRAGTNPIDRLP